MFIAFPYKTDAAIDHQPWGTLGLIAVNAAVVLLLGFPRDVVTDLWGTVVEEPLINSMVLEFGKLNPLQWITSAFVHGDWFHIGFNMVFLWTFGLVVEGAVGWRRFLLAYLAIAVAESAVVQVLMLGADRGGAFGASGAIYGVMGMAALWAPRNKFTIFFWFLVIMRTFEASVWGFCVVWVGLDLLVALLAGFALSSEILHLLGAALGVATGTVMLKKGWVDCQGWDYFSLRAAGHPVRYRPHHGEPTVVVQDPRADALVRVRDALDAGNAGDADDIYAGVQELEPQWILPRSDLLRLIDALTSAKLDERAARRFEELLRVHPAGSDAVRLPFAQVLLRLRRPRGALDQLEQAAADRLTEAQRTAKRKLEARARAQLERGGLEIE